MAGYQLPKQLIILSNRAVIQVFLFWVVTWEDHSNLSLFSLPIAHCFIMYVHAVVDIKSTWLVAYLEIEQHFQELLEKFWGMGSLPPRKQEDLLLHACCWWILSLHFFYFSSHFFRYNSYGSSSYSSPRPYTGVSAPTTPTTRYGTTLSPPQETKSDRFVN